MDEIKSTVSPQDALLQKKLAEVKAHSKDPEKLKQAAQDFEALFIQYMLKTMRKTIMKSGWLEDGQGGEIMEGLYDQKISQKIAQDKPLGLAELFVNQLSTTKETEASPPRSLRGLPFRRMQSTANSIETYRKNQPDLSVRPFERHIRNAAKESGVDANLIRAVIMAESGGNPQAVSSKNARGLMQLIDSTAAEVGVKDPLDPAQNIKGGSKYLAKMLDKFDGNKKLALAAYNAGPTAVKKHQGIPPYRETREYVNRVMAFYRQFNENIPSEE